MRRWEPHDPGRSRLLDVITHYVTNQSNSQNDGALPLAQGTMWLMFDTMDAYDRGDFDRLGEIYAEDARWTNMEAAQSAMARGR